MLNWIKNWIAPKKQKNYLTIGDNENAIVFSVNESDKLSLKISLQNLDSEKSAQKMAEVLFFMNKGLYQKQIQEMLEEIAKQNPDREKFVSHLILYLEAYVDTYKNESYNNDSNCPVVAPTKFLSSIIQAEK